MIRLVFTDIQEDSSRIYANGVENDDGDDKDVDEGHALQLQGSKKDGLCAVAWMPEKGGKPNDDGYGKDGITEGRGGGGGGCVEKSAILDPKSKKEYGLVQMDGANMILALSEVCTRDALSLFASSMNGRFSESVSSFHSAPTLTDLCASWVVLCHLPPLGSRPDHKGVHGTFHMLRKTST
ncbi:hypothetical protein Baya_15281 [Bagarius yarrelli]|uniref:Uncharacterized protein n=1 Tax=Bagarius yarrelli TaxID=175774 RepID=A0A556VBG4_BAGYA|nr:hypothetical protein Baya_15281 [Bagarius yarrelli]